MGRSDLLEGLRAMKFENIYGRFSGGELTQAEADELLGVRERTFRRWCHRYRDEGEDGLRDRRVGVAAANRVGDAQAERAEALYRGFTAKHFYERSALLVPMEGSLVSRTMPTQDGRALAQLGIEHIAAYSPEARGRSGRAFRTLQDRLPKELALAGITTVAGANAWLRETYVPQHNARFAVAAEQAGSAFVAVPGVDLLEVPCHEEARMVGNDNTVVLKKVRLQIPRSPLRAHYVRATVAVRRSADESDAVFRGPRCIGRYDATGLGPDEPMKQAA